MMTILKKVLYGLSLMAFAVMGFVACEDAAVDNNITLEYQASTLYAVTPQTRVDFTDNGSEGIALAWEVGDKFTLYTSANVRVGDFTCRDAQECAFSSPAQLTEGASYKAIYPASDEESWSDAAPDITVQDGDKINDLSGACHMESEAFTYSSGG